jgi:membrane protein YqaA with SNARE-associated domain
VFERLYNRVLLWATHPKANRFLMALSFAESSFFPIPPDVMLAPMCLAKPSKGYYYALLTTIASVLGGVFGYLIGMFSFELVAPLIEWLKYDEKFELVKLWFASWGFWAILIAGFSPIPYKLFTIAAGLLGMAFIPFVIASIIGRGARFFLLAGLVSLGGEKLRNKLKDYIEIIGWCSIGILLVGVLIYKIQ